MSYSAKVFRILIASPSDVEVEREIAVKTIQEWNDLNSAERQVVLLPLRWETHAAPEFGRRPQQIINEQVVDHCDILVGIFWTRIGSPTGKAESGTLEEIERVAEQGKLVMLYFSQSKQQPDQLDLEQLAQLREFKSKTFPNALVENFSSQIDFRDKLSKHLEIQLRTLMAQGDEVNDQPYSPGTNIQIHFSDTDTGEDVGLKQALACRRLYVDDFEKLPDYSPDEDQPSKSGGLASAILALSGTSRKSINKHYYRQLMTYVVGKAFFKPLRFWLKNLGKVGAKDVYIDVSIKSDGVGLYAVSPSRIGSTLPSPQSSGGLLSDYHPNSLDDLFGDISESWSTQIELRALQPQREISPEISILIGAEKDCEVSVVARIYADTLSEPLTQELSIDLTVEEEHVVASDFIEDLPDISQSEKEGNEAKQSDDS
jgi:hypothetical protein